MRQKYKRLALYVQHLHCALCHFRMFCQQRNPISYFMCIRNSGFPRFVATEQNRCQKNLNKIEWHFIVLFVFAIVICSLVCDSCELCGTDFVYISIVCLNIFHFVAATAIENDCQNPMRKTSLAMPLRDNSRSFYQSSLPPQSPTAEESVQNYALESITVSRGKQRNANENSTWSHFIETHLKFRAQHHIFDIFISSSPRDNRFAFRFDRPFGRTYAHNSI